MSHYSPQEISGELSKHQAAERQKGCFQWRVDLPTMYPTFVCQRDCWRHFGEIWYLLPMLREFFVSDMVSDIRGVGRCKHVGMELVWRRFEDRLQFILFNLPKLWSHYRYVLVHSLVLPYCSIVSSGCKNGIAPLRKLAFSVRILYQHPIVHCTWRCDCEVAIVNVVMNLYYSLVNVIVYSVSSSHFPS